MTRDHVVATNPCINVTLVEWVILISLLVCTNIAFWLTKYVQIMFWCKAISCIAKLLCHHSKPVGISSFPRAPRPSIAVDHAWAAAPPYSVAATCCRAVTLCGRPLQEEPPPPQRPGLTAGGVARDVEWPWCQLHALVHEDDVQILGLVGRFYTSCSGIWYAVCPYVLPLLSTSVLLVNCVGSRCLLFFCSCR
jgi:hypothetical protein